MNRKLVLFLHVLLVCCIAKSQSSYGIKAGINLADQVKIFSIPQVPASSPETRPFIGYQVGVFYKTKPKNGFSFSMETNFSVIGSSRILISPDWNSYDTHEKLGYIELPLLLQYTVHKMVYLGIGPSIGFKLFSKITHYQNNSYNISGYQTFDAAANFLAGIRISKKFDANIRYSHGLVNILKDPDASSVKNRFLNFSILYALK
jgi:hypothetical protein